MRPVPAAYRLSFLLPDGALASGAAAHCPAKGGCILLLHAAGLVEITGPSTAAVFEHAARFLRIACRGLPATVVPLTLRTRAEGWGGVDSWQAAIGADVSFFPTAVEPYLPQPPAQAARPPPLALVKSGEPVG